MTEEYFLYHDKKFILEETPAPPAGIPLPAGEYYFIEHDDLAKDEKGQRIRAPEVWPLYYVEYTELTEAWQWFWFRTGLVHPFTRYKHWDEKKLPIADYEMLIQEWRSLTHGAKAFTNNFGTELYRDYISGRNKGMDNPQQGSITCCGHIVKKVGNITGRGIPIETLDGTKPPPAIDKVNRLTMPWLFTCAVNIPGYKEGGKEFPYYVIHNGVKRVKADPFPNLWRHGVEDTIVPLRSNGRKTGITYTRDGVNYATNFIRGDINKRLIPYHDSIVPRPYIP